MKSTLTTTILLFLVISISIVLPKSFAQQLKIVPCPRVVKNKDLNFEINKNTKIVVCDRNSKADLFSASILQKDLRRATGFEIKIINGRYTERRTNRILLCEDNRSSGVNEILSRHNISLSKSFDPEGYIIDVSRKEIVVAANTSTGIFYGVQTLRQLVNYDKESKVVGVHIEDWPAMKIRAVMNDISTCSVTKPEYIKRQIRICAEYKINMFVLYFEQTFAYKAFPLVSRPDGSLTASDIRDLVTYSEKYHVQLVPVQESFAHMHDLLKYQLYQNLAETPNDWEFNPVKDSIYSILKTMYSEITPLFPSKYFCIGADETGTLGMGRSKNEAEKEGLGKFYADYINRLDDLLKPYHKEVMLWGDQVLAHPKALKYLHKDLIVGTWHYTADSSFDNYIEPFVKAGLRVIVTPNTRNWIGTFPDYDISMINIRNFVRDGQKYHVLGMMNTVWGDSRASFFPMSWYGILFSAEAAWHKGEANIEHFRKSFDWAFYRSKDTTIAHAINDLSSIHTLFHSVGLGEEEHQYFWTNPFTEEGASFVEKALPIAGKVRTIAEKSYRQIEFIRHKIKSNKGTLDYLLYAARNLDYLGMLIEYANQIDLTYYNVYLHPHSSKSIDKAFFFLGYLNSKLNDFIDYLSWLKRDYTILWNEENFPYRLDKELVRYDLDMQFWEREREKFIYLGKIYRQGKKLPPPEKLGFFIKN